MIKKNRTRQLGSFLAFYNYPTAKIDLKKSIIPKLFIQTRLSGIFHKDLQKTQQNTQLLKSKPSFHIQKVISSYPWARTIQKRQVSKSHPQLQHRKYFLAIKTGKHENNLRGIVKQPYSNLLSGSSVTDHQDRIAVRNNRSLCIKSNKSKSQCIDDVLFLRGNIAKLQSPSLFEKQKIKVRVRNRNVKGSAPRGKSKSVYELVNQSQDRYESLKRQLQYRPWSTSESQTNQ